MNNRLRYMLLCLVLVTVSGCQTQRKATERFSNVLYQYTVDLTAGDTTSAAYATVWKEIVTRHGVIISSDNLNESFPLDSCTVKFNGESLEHGAFSGTFLNEDLETIPLVGLDFPIQVEEFNGDEFVVRMDWPQVDDSRIDIPDEVAVGDTLRLLYPAEQNRCSIDVLKRFLGEDVYIGDGTSFPISTELAGQTILIQVSYRQQAQRYFQGLHQDMDYLYIWRKRVSVTE